MIACRRGIAFGFTLLALAGRYMAIAAADPPRTPAPTKTATAKTAAPAAEEKNKDHYLRLVRDQSGKPVAMETAIVRFVPRDCGQTGPTVDLVGAVHIADRGYYQQLNREFADYDAVLYELVAPPDAKVPEGGIQHGGNLLSSMQLGLKDMLELEFQLNAVKYNRPNMVHADMSPEQFAQSMKKKNESVMSMFFRMLSYAMARQSEAKGDDMDFLAAIFDKHRALALKRLMAEQFADMEGTLAALDGPAGSTIISERNKVALGVLKQQIAAGKQKLAIFYGAGHMPNMEQRLREQFDLAPIETRWLRAWDMKSPAESPVKPRRKSDPSAKAESKAAAAAPAGK